MENIDKIYPIYNLLKDRLIYILKKNYQGQYEGVCGYEIKWINPIDYDESLCPWCCNGGENNTPKMKKMTFEEFYLRYYKDKE